MPTEPISRYFQVASSERGVVVEVDQRAPWPGWWPPWPPTSARGGATRSPGHHGQEDEQAGAEDAVGRARGAAQVARRVERAEQEQHADHAAGPAARAGRAPSQPRGRRSRPAGPAPASRSGPGGRRRRPAGARGASGCDGIANGQGRGQQGNEDEQRAPWLTPSARPAAACPCEENSRLMWWMMMPITKMPTNRSSSTPISTRNGIASSSSRPKMKMPFSSTR